MKPSHADGPMKRIGAVAADHDAMVQMKTIDIAALERAHQGA